MRLPEDWQRQLEEGLLRGREGVVGMLLIHPDGRIFVQKRSPHRRLFPGCWDLVGGHIEPGESLSDALIRELAEETSWSPGRLLGLRKVVDWEAPSDAGPVLKREFVIALEPQGDLDNPVLEWDRVTEGRWLSPGETPLLREGRLNDRYVFDLVSDEFQLRDRR